MFWINFWRLNTIVALILCVANWYILDANVLAKGLITLRHLTCAGVYLLWWNEATMAYFEKVKVYTSHRDTPALILVLLLWVAGELIYHMPLNWLCWTIFSICIVATIHLVWMFCRRFFTIQIIPYEEE